MTEQFLRSARGNAGSLTPCRKCVSQGVDMHDPSAFVTTFDACRSEKRQQVQPESPGVLRPRAPLAGEEDQRRGRRHAAKLARMQVPLRGHEVAELWIEREASLPLALGRR